MRRWWDGEEFDPHEIAAAVNVIRAWRAQHAPPLAKVAVGLRYYVDKHTTVRPIRVGQRLKRLRTIVDKLSREPGMDLARMHDIGGCRAVVGSEAEVRAIAAHLKRRWEWEREYDYIAQPKLESGYRGYHLVVKKDRLLVEVQVRMVIQHSWAELVEIVDRLNPDIELKGGRAPAELTEYYRLGSDLLAAREAGEVPDDATIKRFRRLHETVASYLPPRQQPPL
ncbi:MAG TPA: RelA/SpoT domain-containing protein [Solirubrobacteraceae bacterium]|jgi:ppGpp synthetase/RelA/SpoT-type nucleotidyltranferase